MSDRSPNTIEVGFPTLLGLLFIALKLCNVIEWSWFWVLAPFWIPLGIAVTIFIICCCTVFMAFVFEYFARRF